MKNILYSLLISAIALSCAGNPKGLKITIGNPSTFDRMSELAEIPLESIAARLQKPIENGSIAVKDQKGNPVPSQISFCQGFLLIQPQLKAGETKNFYLTVVDSVPVFAPKVWGRLMPERKDDFAWENDRVAFRIYGNALKAIDGASNRHRHLVQTYRRFYYGEKSGR